MRETKMNPRKFGKGGEIATNRLDDQEVAVLSLHLLQICLVYMLSRDFGGYMLAPHALLNRLRVVQRNRPWTLHLPFLQWQIELCLSERFSGSCHQNHEIIHQYPHDSTDLGGQSVGGEDDYRGFPRPDPIILQSRQPVWNIPTRYDRAVSA
jgi:hypothetical protein